MLPPKLVSLFPNPIVTTLMMMITRLVHMTILKKRRTADDNMADHRSAVVVLRRALQA